MELNAHPDGEIVAFRGYKVGTGKKMKTASYREILRAPLNPTMK